MNINKYKQTAGTGHPDRNRNHVKSVHASMLFCL